MKIIQTMWNAITTQNEIALNIVGFFSCFIDTFVNMLLFTTILNIKTTKSSKLIYVIFMGLIAFLSRTFIPDPYGIFFNMIFIIFIIKFMFKTTWLKSLLSEFIVIALSSVLELFIFKFYQKLFNISQDQILTVALYRTICAFSIYLCVYLIYRLIKYLKFHITLENMTQRNKVLFIINTLLGILAIGTQFCLIVFYSDKMPVAITVVSILSICTYFAISIYSLLSTNKLDTTTRDLEEAQLYNKTLSILHDSMRGFKHDFHNIVQGIGGYADRGDLEGLKKYYKQLLQDCNQVNNLESLNPNSINSPAVYSVLANKYYKADNLGIKIYLETFIDFNNLYMGIYEFTRILGILMDNAIEATSECDKKYIHVEIRNDLNRNRQLLIIENTYKDKNINIDKIYEKSYSTKPHNTGFGLWEVENILKKHKNITRFTTKDDQLFKQQIEIYKN